MLGKKNGQRRMREAVIAFIVFVGMLPIPLVYIWFAGYDCEAPDDSDLAVQEEVNWGPEQEREFAAFTNVLARAEHLEECNDDIKYERGDVEYERAVDQGIGRRCAVSRL